MSTPCSRGRNFCFLFGRTKPFDASALKALYPTHDAFVKKFVAATDALVTEGYLLKPEVELLLAVKPEQVKIPDGFSYVFLYRSTELLQFELEKVQKYKIAPIYQPGDVWLWRLEK